MKPSSNIIFNLALSAGILVAPGCPAEPHGELGHEVRVDLERFSVPTEDDDYALGTDTPLVTIVVFGDYACAPCGKTWQVMRHLEEHYKDDIRIVYRSGTVPGFTHGERAAEAAYAAGAQGKFWEMHWRLYENPIDFSRPVLREHAEELGLDVPRFVDDLDDGAFSGRRARDRRAATVLGITAMPVVFVNGLFVLGFKDEDGMRALVEAEMANARQWMAEGTPRAQLYDKIMEGAVKERGAVAKVTAGDDKTQALQQERAKAAGPKVIKAPNASDRYAVPLAADSPDAIVATLGPKDAAVVVVEFLDFQCPFCRKAHEHSTLAIRKKYGDAIRWEVRHLPLEIHASAEPAARASLAAHRQGKFWDFHDLLFGRTESLSRKGFVAHATSLGLDVPEFERDFESAPIRAQVREDVALARVLGVDGTPGFFINGRYLSGALTSATYTDLIDEELARAKELRDAGTPQAELHDALMEGALAPEQFPNATNSQ